MNGVDPGILSETVNAIQADPELGKSRFRATNKWLSGNHSRITVTDFYGAKQVIPHRQTLFHSRFKRLAEYPPVFNTITQGARVDIRVEPK